MVEGLFIRHRPWFSPQQSRKGENGEKEEEEEEERSERKGGGQFLYQF